MALVNCRDCGTPVSTDATHCPRCGCRNPYIFTCSTCGVGLLAQRYVIMRPKIQTRRNDPDLTRRDLFDLTRRPDNTTFYCRNCMPLLCPFCGKQYLDPHHMSQFISDRKWREDGLFEFLWKTYCCPQCSATRPKVPQQPQPLRPPEGNPKGSGGCFGAISLTVVSLAASLIRLAMFARD